MHTGDGKREETTSAITCLLNMQLWASAASFEPMVMLRNLSNKSVLICSYLQSADCQLTVMKHVRLQCLTWGSGLHLNDLASSHSFCIFGQRHTFQPCPAGLLIRRSMPCSRASTKVLPLLRRVARSAVQTAMQPMFSLQSRLMHKSKACQPQCQEHHMPCCDAWMMVCMCKASALLLDLGQRCL